MATLENAAKMAETYAKAGDLASLKVVMQTWFRVKDSLLPLMRTSELLHEVYERGDLKMADYLVSQCEADVNSVDANRVTLPIKAILDDSWRFLRLVLWHRADINLAHPSAHFRASGPPLHEAYVSGRWRLVDMLLAAGADVNVRDRSGDAMLHIAVQMKKPKLLRRLMDHKADVNVQNHAGETPLQLAVVVGDLKMVELLLDHGARTDILSAYGCDAFMTAVSSRTQYSTSVMLAVMKKYPENCIVWQYELLGAYFGQTGDVDAAMRYWTMAMEYRWKDPRKPVLKNTPPSSVSAITGVSEPNSMEELEELNRLNSDQKLLKVRLWSMATAERILWTCPETVINIMFEVVQHLEGGDSTKALNLFRHVLAMPISRSRMLKTDVLQITLSLLSKACNANQSGGFKFPVLLLRKIFTCLEGHFNTTDLEDRNSQHYRIENGLTCWCQVCNTVEDLVNLFLQTICLFKSVLGNIKQQAAPVEEEIAELTKIVKQMLILNPRVGTGTILDKASEFGPWVKKVFATATVSNSRSLKTPGLKADTSETPEDRRLHSLLTSLSYAETLHREEMMESLLRRDDYVTGAGSQGDVMHDVMRRVRIEDRMQGVKRSNRHVYPNVV